ncbi:hypothetical protein PV797_05660 [Clostridiaceae bacterium M8S5]|nr:hypothetical protein PV797_05660 [Clostridiaceae bacterium M8S5]
MIINIILITCIIVSTISIIYSTAFCRQKIKDIMNTDDVLLEIKGEWNESNNRKYQIAIVICYVIILIISTLIIAEIIRGGIDESDVPRLIFPFMLAHLILIQSYNNTNIYLLKEGIICGKLSYMKWSNIKSYEIKKDVLGRRHLCLKTRFIGRRIKLNNNKTEQLEKILKDYLTRAKS